MTLRPLVLALFSALALPLSVNAANYTYHGDLMDGDAPAEGAYDLRVRAFPHPGATKAMAEAIELPGVKLSAGRFSVELDLPEDADGTTWVEVAVRKAGSNEAFEKLGAPQPISKANSTCPGAWALDGNTGLPAGSFLGLADPANLDPLVLKAGNYAVATLTPRGTAGDYGNAPGVALGSPANTATGRGAVVSGGGATHDGGTSCATCGNHAGGDFSSVGGGFHNIASIEGSTVGGGKYNIAAGQLSVVGGGYLNSTSGAGSAVGGGMSNCAGGSFSWAGGKNARVRSAMGTGLGLCSSNTGDADGDEGTFVWADTTNSYFVSTGPKQFLIRANGGVGINTTTFGNAVDLRGSEVMVKNNSFDGNSDLTLINSTNRGYVLASVPPPSGTGAGEFFIGEADARAANVLFVNHFRIDSAGVTHTRGGVVGDMSDARLKKNFAPIAKPLDTLLALRGTMFEYIEPARAMSEPGPRMGFIAQEVQKVLPNWVHPSLDGYLSVGTIGFEALAVEAIRDLKVENDVENDLLSQELNALKRDNAALREQLDALTERFARLETRQGH